MRDRQARTRRETLNCCIVAHRSALAASHWMPSSTSLSLSHSPIEPRFALPCTDETGPFPYKHSYLHAPKAHHTTHTHTAYTHTAQTHSIDTLHRHTAQTHSIDTQQPQKHTTNTHTAQTHSNQQPTAAQQVSIRERSVSQALSSSIHSHSQAPKCTNDSDRNKLESRNKSDLSGSSTEAQQRTP
jgi:hypothetical protein